MVDAESIAAAFTGLKTAYDITTGLLQFKGGTEFQDKIIELQRIIVAAQQDTFAAQSTQAELLERVRELEKQVAQFETWETEKQRYKLNDFGERSLISLKNRKEMANHRIICALAAIKKGTSLSSNSKIAR